MPVDLQFSVAFRMISIEFQKKKKKLQVFVQDFETGLHSPSRVITKSIEALNFDWIGIEKKKKIKSYRGANLTRYWLVSWCIAW